MKHIGVPAHPLDEPCPCGHARWLHTVGGCVAQRPTGTSQMQFSPCGCVRSSKDFA
jgi:hypothetical protein